MPHGLTPETLQMLHVFDRINKSPAYGSPKIRLLQIDNITDTEGQQMDALSKEGIISTKHVHQNGQVYIQIELLEPLSTRWKAMAVEYLSNT